MKKTFALMLMTAALALAGTKGNPDAWVAGTNTFAPDYISSTYGQYDHDEAPINGGDYQDISGNSSEAYTAQIRLSVVGGTKVWLTNWVSSWESIPDLNTPFNMVDEEMYGYFTTEGGAINWSDGSISTITYGEGTEHQVTTTGYLLDYFEEDTDIFLVLTPRDDEMATLDFTVDTAEAVNANGNLIARFDGDGAMTDYDLAGNVKINFTLANYGDRTFVAVFETPRPAGQPLPGTLMAGLLSMGTILVSRRMKKRG